MNQVYVNGIGCYPFQSVEDLFNLALSEKKILVAINAEKIINASALTRSIINSNIGYCDGYGAVLALKHKGYDNVIKIPGCELWLDLIKLNYKSKSFYLIGGSEETINKTIVKLEIDFPGINIKGFHNGFFQSTNEKNNLINNVVKTSPDFVFVAMGSPKQELLMQEMQDYHTAIYQGLGGSFDVYVGKVKRAPIFFRNLRLEWAYRLFKQPTRIKRQILLLKFFLYLKLGKL